MPAPFISDSIGASDDRIRLVLGGDEIVIAEGWDVSDGVMQVPSSWTIRLGWGDVAAGILARYKKGDPFQAYIGSALQATGRLDAIGASQSPGGATELELRGRDMLGVLHDTAVTAQVSFKDTTYQQLVERAIGACRPFAKNGFVLHASNTANRQVKAGVPVTEVGPVRTVDQVLQEGVGFAIGVVTQELQAKVQEKWLQFLRRYLDRAGLFLWCAADGSFVLSEPNGKQEPVYAIVRRRGDPTKQANVVGMSFMDDATSRHSECVIYGRGGGRRHGPTKPKGGFVDDEMVALGYDQPIAFRDANVHTDQEAAFFARRKLAEERRNGWRLEYTIAGLTLPVATGGSSAWAVVTPDTLVAVDDQELNIKGNFYIESVRRQRAPQTTTTIRLMRATDLIFGSDEDEGGGANGGGTGDAPTTDAAGAASDELNKILDRLLHR